MSVFSCCQSLTSGGVQQLGPPDEAQVSGPGPHCLSLTKAQVCVEVISLQVLLSVNGVVATGVVRAVHPDLSQTNQKKKRKKKSLYVDTISTKIYYIFLHR